MKSAIFSFASAVFFSSLIAAAPKAPSVPTVRIQLNGISGEDAIQRDVPADGSAFSLIVSSPVSSAQIVDDACLRAASCEVFSDLKGLVPASELSFTVADTPLLIGSVGTVDVGSVRCSHQ
jgi:hypothetical protein